MQLAIKHLYRKEWSDGELGYGMPSGDGWLSHEKIFYGDLASLHYGEGWFIERFAKVSLGEPAIPCCLPILVMEKP